ncbi:hypothetical protein ACHAW6_001119 [Cyclotella cf. meneghiniana]
MVFLRAAAVLALFLLIHEASMLTFAFSLSSNSNRDALHKCDNTQGLGNNVGAADVMANSSRRSFFHSTAAAVFVHMIISVEPSNAAADCFNDCFKNCKLIAPKDPQYCQINCQDYCSQTDRTDGLSGSVSSSGGETGILGTNTVVKGEDKPPQVKIPGLDFTSDKGRKLIGY